MGELEIRSAPDPVAAIVRASSCALTPRQEQQLLARAHERVLMPARTAGLELTLLGVTRVPVGPEVVDVHGQPWLVVDAFEDPFTAATGGRQVLPAVVKDELVRMLQAGVDPDRLHIAHELPPGTSLEAAKKMAPPPAPGRQDADRRLARKLAAGLAVGVGAVAMAAAAPVLLTAGAAGAMLDPVLLGGVETKDGTRVLWTELARWSW